MSATEYLATALLQGAITNVEVDNPPCPRCDETNWWVDDEAKAFGCRECGAGWRLA